MSLEKAQQSLQRASEVQFEPVTDPDAPLRRDVPPEWPDARSRNEFAIALLADAVRHLIDHLKEPPVTHTTLLQRLWLRLLAKLGLRDH